MTRLVKISLVLIFSCLVIYLVGWAFYAAFSRYTKAKQWKAEVEMELDKLKVRAHPRWRVLKQQISLHTADSSPASKFMDFRLAANTNDPCKFTGRFVKSMGHIICVWVSDWTPRAEMGKFEQLNISPAADGIGFELTVKPREGESIRMVFTATAIFED